MACVNEAAMAADPFDRESVDINPVALQARCSQDYVDYFLNALVKAIDRQPTEAVNGNYLQVLDYNDGMFFRLPTQVEAELVNDYLRSKGWITAIFNHHDVKKSIHVYLSAPKS